VSTGIVEPPALELQSVDAGYGRVPVLHDIDFAVPSGQVVALIGANGAGKTTTLKVASGLVRPTNGSVMLRGQEITDVRTHKRAQSGICLIPEGRGIFRALTVRENLRLAVPPWIRPVDTDPALAAFPVLKTRLGQVAGTLSGGEQQMLALGRAFLSRPRIILIDELSLGLAPVIIDRMFESVRTLADGGVSLVIVEQYVTKVLPIAETAYILVRGRITWTGRAGDVNEDLLVASYLGES
jgi:branched-chain amino acid transport system ATP-binding protein